MASVMLFPVVCFVSVVYGIYESGQFIYKGDVACAKRLPAFKEILAPSEVNTFSFCAMHCRMFPQCKAIAMCEQNESKLCRLFNFKTLPFSATTNTDSCRLLQLDNGDTESCSKEECTASIFHSCKDILDNTNGQTVLSGVYTININNKSTEVWCDMDTDGGGWTVIQRRQNGNTDFFQSWNEYKKGFGNACDEYWIGNDALHILTTTRSVTLRIDLERFNGQQGYMTFSTFRVANDAEMYRLSLSGYSGTINDCSRYYKDDCLSYNNGNKFSTKDSDNDNLVNLNCADAYNSGWWFAGCTWSNLNGQYQTSETVNGANLFCYQWTGDSHALKKSKMMIR